MRVSLTPHPETLSTVVESVDVSAHRGKPERITLTCGLIGDVNRISIPRPGLAMRADELWKHTCYELFIQADGGSYYEFNFSPSLQWAAYRFSSYRKGMANAEPTFISGLGLRVETGGFGGYAEVDLSDLPGLDLTNPLRIGLSAVIEESDGRKTYWALAHPPGKPDFHHPVAFAGDLPSVVYW